MKKLFLFVLVLVSAFSLEVHGGHAHGRRGHRHYNGHHNHVHHRGPWRGGHRYWDRPANRWWWNNAWYGPALFALDSAYYGDCPLSCRVRVRYNDGTVRYRCHC